MVLPSGDTAAAPATAPSGAFHSSFARSPESRHTASAPPRDARYRADPSGPKRGAADRAVGNGIWLAASSPTTPSVMGTVHRCTAAFDTVATSRRSWLGTSALAAIEMYCSTPTLTRCATRRCRSIEYNHGPVPSSAVAV